MLTPKLQCLGSDTNSLTDTLNPVVSVQCPPGYSCSDGSNAVECASGYYSSGEALKCTPCDGTSYARAGASECTVCEENTERKVRK